jgi:hypothetical protein
MSLKKFTMAIAALVMAFAVSSRAQAETLVYSDFAEYGASGSDVTTNWSQSLSLNKYSGAYTIDLVKFILDGHVIGSAQAESLDGSATNVTLNLSANIAATGPGSLNVTVVPVASQVFNATAYDGTIDFGGTSGVTYGSLSNTGSATQSITSPVSIAAFLGAGTFSFTLAATGASSGSGAGNLITQFATQAHGGITVEYYTSEVPTPAALPAGLALIGGLAFRRGRSSK